MTCEKTGVTVAEAGQVEAGDMLENAPSNGSIANDSIIVREQTYKKLFPDPKINDSIFPPY